METEGRDGEQEERTQRGGSTHHPQQLLLHDLDLVVLLLTLVRLLDLRFQPSVLATSQE